MDKAELFKALLRAEVYQEFKHKARKEIFPEQLWDLYEAMEVAHGTSSKDITCKELFAVYEVLNSTVTKSQRNVIIDIVKKINESESLQPDIVAFVLDKALTEVKANAIAQAALEISHGKSVDWEKIRSLLDEDVTKETIQLVSTDLRELFETKKNKFSIRFNIEPLHEATGCAGPGNFIVIAGPVNSGKSALGMHFEFGPGGFLEQNLRCLHVGNEDPMTDIMLRAASCNTGMTQEEMADNMDEALRRFEKVKHNCFPIDDYAMNFTKLSYIAKKLKPDVVVLDMLDKIHVTGDFKRGDEKLGRIYELAREFAKKHQCLVIGLSQTSAESFGKLYYSFDRLANSRVEKAANADKIFLLGSQTNEFTGDADKNFRVINIAKSKDLGNGKTINCQIVPQLSRFIV